MRSESKSDGQRSFIEEARRKQILAAAVEVLAELGYGKASLARIAERAGISKGVISYHFDGKNDLVEQVVIGLYVAGGEYMAPLIDAADGHLAKLRTYITSNIDFIDANRAHIAAMTEVVLNYRTEDGALKFAADDGENAIIEPLVELLSAGQQAGEFGQDFTPRLVAELIRDAIDGAAGRLIRAADWDVQAYGKQLADLLEKTVTA